MRESDFLTITDNPCVACGERVTIGVGYSNPEETKFWCAEHLPEEFWTWERLQEAGRGRSRNDGRTQS
jgi:hypothetical protein